MPRALYLCRLALRYQSALNNQPHRVDQAMRWRAWIWWSEAQKEGVVVG